MSYEVCRRRTRIVLSSVFFESVMVSGLDVRRIDYFSLESYIGNL